MVENEHSDEDAWNRFLAENPSTTPAYQFTFRGGVDEALIEKMVGTMSYLTDIMSRIVPLQDLDGITVAADYQQALIDLDRGMATSEVIEPTDESFGTGMAMASAVIREGQVKTHVTFHAALIAGLVSEDKGLVELSTHTFAHELGHVAEHTLDSERFGEAMRRPLGDRYEFELYRRSRPSWSEYYASRVSAGWKADAIEGLRELLRGSLEQLIDRLGISDGKLGASMASRSDEAALEVLDQITKLMKYAGYVIGHARGADMEPLEQDSAEFVMLEQIGLDGWFADLASALDELYDGRNEWAELAVFYPLHRLFEEGCLHFKLELLRSDDYAVGWRFWF